MVNVYLNDEIELELLLMAEIENKELLKQDKKPVITKARIATRIIEKWYKERKEKWRDKVIK